MNNTVSFHKTIVPQQEELPSLAKLEELWDLAIKHYESERYLDSLLATIDYININARKKFGNNEQTEFCFSHGSVLVNLKIDNDKISITSPFLKLPENAKIALLRRVAEINFNKLQLAKIVLKGDELSFRFECPLALCYPNKIYDVFRIICFNADYYDDEFVTQFGAVRIQEPVITFYTNDLIDKSFEQFTAYIKECQEYVAYFEGKRMTGFAWDIYCMFFRKLEYFLKPKGNIGNTIADMISELDSSNKSMADRNSAAKKVVLQLQTITKENLKEDLYYTDEFIPWKYYGKLERIQEYFEDSHEIATSELNKGEYMACACTILLCYYRMLYSYRLTPEIQQFIEYNLEQTSEKPWKEAAELLFNSLDNFMEGNLLIAMTNNEFDTNDFMKAFTEGNTQMNDYMKQAMEMSKKMMAKFMTN